MISQGRLRKSASRPDRVRPAQPTLLHYVCYYSIQYTVGTSHRAYRQSYHSIRAVRKVPVFGIDKDINIIPIQSYYNIFTILFGGIKLFYQFWKGGNGCKLNYFNNDLFLWHNIRKVYLPGKLSRLGNLFRTTLPKMAAWQSSSVVV